MRKLDIDLSIIGSVTILVMVLWSNLSGHEDWSIGVLVLLGMFLCSYNIFMLLERDSETRCIFIIHVYLFYILGAFLLSLMLIEETSFKTAVLYFLAHMLLPLFTGLLLQKIEIEQQRKLKLMLFALSVFLLGVGLIFVLTILV